ncbi:MAG: STAS domain-containing protein [Candidatus Omnitrophica bacterium]|nr:STAS domain-containing protein [Candidatus Omnitrophota bacterium]
MEIKIEPRERITVAEIIGNIDSATSPQAQEKLMPLANNKCCLALDLTNCKYVSSAGLRVLLMLAKQFTAQGSTLALAGLCDEVRDVMDMTGFINFFKLYDSIDDVLNSI